jgi:hypothetical protein
MPISDDLFLSLLSMDAYNRNYNVGINVSGNQIGTATRPIRGNGGGR